MEHSTAGKYRALCATLREWERVAIAYSGGVDSSLLCFAAVNTLGIDNTLILHARSCLLSRQAEADAQRFLNEDLRSEARSLTVDVHPLSSAQFIQNSADRCYVCKYMIYSKLKEAMTREGFVVLADGTNCDDLSENRPGLRAIRELGVETPLVVAGFSKSDIREVAAGFDLSSAGLPANSCLATRVPPGEEIEIGRLKEIEMFESFLSGLGFNGCRVRPAGDTVILEVRQDDLHKVVRSLELSKIITYFQSNGYARVLLDLIGR